MNRRRKLVAAEAALLLVGFVFLGWAGYKTADSVLTNSWQDYRFEQALAGKEPGIFGYLRHLTIGGKTTPHAEGEQPAIEPVPPARATRKFKRDETIGRIEIDRIDISAVVKEGADTKTLSRAVGHVPYTALPGEKGNVGVAAHRDTYFRGLRHVRHGDVIRVTTMDGIYLYEVDKLKIVWPKNVEVLDPTPEKRITLVTCYPFNFVGSAPKRFIVQAKQVGFEELQASSARSVKQGS